MKKAIYTIIISCVFVTGLVNKVWSESFYCPAKTNLFNVRMNGNVIQDISYDFGNGYLFSTAEKNFGGSIGVKSNNLFKTEDFYFSGATYLLHKFSLAEGGLTHVLTCIYKNNSGDQFSMVGYYTFAEFCKVNATTDYWTGKLMSNRDSCTSPSHDVQECKIPLRCPQL